MKKIKTALLSYGMSGKVFHAPFLNAHPGFELIGAWERSTKNIQQNYHSTESFNSFEALLQSDTELIVVNTPVATHFEYTKAALNAGKHVLVEKSFTTNAAEAQELDNLAKSRGLKLCVYQNRRWDSDFLTVKKVLDEGVLGDIVEAEIRFDRYNPVLSPKAHKEVAEPGAGILWDLGSHVIDQALQLFGFPEAVYGDLRKTRNNSLIDDDFSIVLYYPDKRIKLHAGFFVREAVPSYAIHGKNGSFLKERGDVQEDQLKVGVKPEDTAYGIEPEDKQGLLHTGIDGEAIRKKIMTERGNYMTLFNALHDALVNDKPVPVPANEGIMTMKIIDAVQYSSSERKIIDVR
ncbi:Gfo/Idh/MocA family oxidoreductase [Flavobacterium sp. J372]|uniref:Gfo/Idh/MocA family oxidoreductase n=1 Tax=Flavobacterium sp. J372 TaxID=2898436 RepID=UPI0021510A47|nr:Gfo/Idh/MocA family oxidoreductase [Flavobacterium sp. J372]MCR5861000.1 Gfo/Idh/MocA family oxidoreductase [Flavobacterium sp. J372]